MKCDLIIDGNFILSKLVYTLHKNNLLFGSLHKSLENTINNYRKWYPFSNVYLVSDSKEKSWRRQIVDDYKSTRKRDSDIDWQFVYNAYSEFKDSVKTTIKILEAPHIEGDDWIAFLCKKANDKGVSTIIVSNDYDIKQIVGYNLDPLWINLMTNEMYNKEKLFLPKNYQIFLNKVSNLPNDDIFNLNDNAEFIQLMNKFISRYEVNETDPIESLVVKIISGDISDNIHSVWSQVKNGKKRGIGRIGAKGIYNQYISEFGDLKLNDPDLYENIADLICERKKISKTQISSIVENVQANFQLMNLNVNNIPGDIIKKMEQIYQSQ